MKDAVLIAMLTGQPINEAPLYAPLPGPSSQNVKATAFQPEGLFLEGNFEKVIYMNPNGTKRKRPFIVGPEAPPEYKGPGFVPTVQNSLFGETINAQVDLKSASMLDFGISGDFTLDCKDEAYSVVGSQIAITNIGVAGDCAHDALDDNGITLKAITYDASKDEITVSAKYSIANVDIILSKNAEYTFAPFNRRFTPLKN